MKKFINFKNPLSRIKTLHQQLVSKEEYLDINGRNPYQVFLDWLLDCIEFGLVVMIIHNVFLGWQGWYNLALIFGYGFAKWVILNMIGEIRKSIKIGEQ